MAGVEARSDRSVAARIELRTQRPSNLPFNREPHGERDFRWSRWDKVATGPALDAPPCWECRRNYARTVLHNLKKEIKAGFFRSQTKDCRCQYPRQKIERSAF